MATFKLVFGLKGGRCVQKEVKDAEAKPLLAKQIGDKIAGDALGFAGYEFEITGGSDYCGFPMRKDLTGIGRKRILTVCGVGVKKAAKGIRQKKTVCGNTIHPKISQVNLKIIKEGKEPLAPPAEAKKETPAEKKEA